MRASLSETTLLRAKRPGVKIAIPPGLRDVDMDADARAPRLV